VPVAKTVVDDIPAVPRRRVPGWLRSWSIVAVCTAAAAVYGVAIERMRLGPPLVMLALGGMTLALCGMALWRVIDPLTRADAVVVRDPRASQGRARELEREKQLVLKAIKEVELDHQMRKIADNHYREMVERYRTRAMRLISEIEVGDNYRELIERELKDRLTAAATAGTAAAAAGTAAAVATSDEPAAPEAAAPEAAAPEAAPTTGVAAAGCPSCGISNDDDARFCKKCGLKLAPN
jgi:hypothetical protein